LLVNGDASNSQSELHHSAEVLTRDLIQFKLVQWHDISFLKIMGKNLKFLVSISKVCKERGPRLAKKTTPSVEPSQ
jgi:hypothetical protein